MVWPTADLSPVGASSAPNHTLVTLGICHCPLFSIISYKMREVGPIIKDDLDVL